jgi:hypothetical protein
VTASEVRRVVVIGVVVGVAAVYFGGVAVLIAAIAFALVVTGYRAWRKREET